MMAFISSASKFGDAANCALVKQFFPKESVKYAP